MWLKFCLASLRWLDARYGPCAACRPGLVRVTAAAGCAVWRRGVLSRPVVRYWGQRQTGPSIGAVRISAALLDTARSFDAPGWMTGPRCAIRGCPCYRCHTTLTPLRSSPTVSSFWRRGQTSFAVHTANYSFSYGAGNALLLWSAQRCSLAAAVDLVMLSWCDQPSHLVLMCPTRFWSEDAVWCYFLSLYLAHWVFYSSAIGWNKRISDWSKWPEAKRVVYGSVVCWER
jgi:hypothetical protein